MNEILTISPSILGRRLLLGQNVFHTGSVLTAEIDLGGLSGLTSCDLAGFAAGFESIFTMGDHPLAGWAGLGDFQRRLNSAECIAISDCLLAATLAIETRILTVMGHVDRITFACTGVPSDKKIALIWETFDPAMSRDAVEVALSGIAEIAGVAITGAPPFERGLERLLARAAQRRINPATATLKMEATRNAIPFYISDKHLILGEGVRQRQPFTDTSTEKAHFSNGKSKERASEVWYRLFIVDGSCIAAIRCEPASVIGDGEQALDGLISALNSEPDRDGIRLNPVPLDDSLHRHLAAQGLAIASVPTPGQIVMLSADGDLKSGAVTQDVTADIHPDYCVLAARAVAARGLDVAGVDLVASDITQRDPDPDNVIRRVDPCPSPALHLWPRTGPPRDVARAVIDHIFPDPQQAHIPSLVFAGDRATSSAAQRAGAMLTDAGYRVGMALKKGVIIDGERHDVPEGRITRAPAMLLRDPSVAAMVTALSLRRVVDYGLGFCRCDGVALLLERGEEDTVTARGVDVLARACSGPFTIDSDHPAVRTVVDRVRAERVILVSPASDHPAVASHLASGGLVATREWGSEGPRIRLLRRDGVLASAPLESRTHTRERLLYAGIHAFALVQAVGLAATG